MLSAMNARTLALSFALLLAFFLSGCGDAASPAKEVSDATDATRVPDGVEVDVDATVAMDVGEDATQDTGDVVGEVTGPALAVRYHRPAGDYAGWALDVTGDVVASGLVATRVDDFGAVFTVPLTATAATVAYQFKRAGESDPLAAVSVTLAPAPEGVWHFSGGELQLLTAPPAIPGPDQLVVYYLRKDGAYDGWGLHTWMDVVAETAWATPLIKGGVDPALGAWWLVDLKPGAASVGVIVHKGDEKDPGADMIVTPPTMGDMVFLTSGSTEIASWPLTLPEFSIAGAAAHWLDEDTIAWSPKATGATRYELRYALDASIAVAGPDVTGGNLIALTPDAAGLASPLKVAFPHLASRGAYTLGTADLAKVPEALRGELVIVARDASGKALDATRVQIPGVLDALYGYDGPLGATLDATGVRVALWAPTAQDVSLQHFPTGATTPTEVAMTRGTDGVWRADGPTAWKNTGYRYALRVFHPVSARVETVTVTDPYAVSLATNGRIAYFVDLADPALKPAGWDALVKPGMAAPEDIVLYETHIRDFSARDASVPAAARGKYRAFTYTGQGTSFSDGMKHLAALATAGLTHIHLLPSFDFATVDEDASRRVDIDSGFDLLCAKNAAVPRELCTTHGTTPISQVLAGLDPTTTGVQAIVGWLRGLDSFNWGYDPVHYDVPEGSYASDPDGAPRILDYRAMVQGLWQVGLRVVTDVVYNHTTQSGLGDRVVLDKVVPGYYHRLNSDSGLVETSTCCANTATEHRMMGRLMVDSVVLWAKQYKVDGFRFDLMGHHMKADILRVRAALDALTVAADGVDGRAIYLYGEGWDFGEVANNARGVNATQQAMAGTGVGTFNDRMRDSVRGGSAFDAGDTIRASQGFINGLYYEPNELGTADAAAKEALLLAADRITVGMAGNLRTFKLTDRTGATRTGGTVPYNGAPTGYTLDPQESINYVEAHDNQTLFDINAYKTKAKTPAADRARMQSVATSVLLYGQGIPFVHAGAEFLRSKSMERDSYDSGDWYNFFDVTGATNNWNVGLPNAEKDQANWPLIGVLLGDATITVSAADIAATKARFFDQLEVRKSSPLFRLRSAPDVQKRLFQHNVGPSQKPGVLVFTVSDATCAGDDLDPQWDGLVIFVNARPEAASFALAGASGWQLHPRLAASSDPLVKTATFAGTTFTVPARTSAVFVLPQGGARGAAPGCNPL